MVLIPVYFVIRPCLVEASSDSSVSFRGKLANYISQSLPINVGISVLTAIFELFVGFLFGLKVFQSTLPKLLLSS